MVAILSDLRKNTKFNTGRWITEEEAQFLCDTIKKFNVDVVYESGTANGFSSCRMSETGVSIITCDPVNRDKVWNEPGFEKYKKNITYIQKPFCDIEIKHSNKRRMFFVDGDHTNSGVQNDWKAIEPHLQIGDVVVLHDMNIKAVCKVWQRAPEVGYRKEIHPVGRHIGLMWKVSSEEEENEAKNKSLDEIAFDTGTDKRSTKHGYTLTYERDLKHLRDKPIKLMEIGVYNGQSHEMWSRYFLNGEIYGIDINPSRIRYEIPRTRLELCDQSSREQLRSYAKKNGPWDIVIDDGSHIMSHMILSFEELWPYVKPGGFYYIEDTYTSFHWNKKFFIDAPKTCVQYFLDMANHISKITYKKGERYFSGIIHRNQTKENMDEIQRTVESIEFQMGLIKIRRRSE